MPISEESIFSHMKKFKLIYLALLATGCASFNEENDVHTTDNSVTASIIVEQFKTVRNTKSASSDVFEFSFKDGDRIGIVPFSNEQSDAHTSQLPLNIVNGVGSSEAKFTTGAGWSLISDGRYGYVAYYPYTENYKDGLEIDFTTQEQSSNGSITHLSQYDILFSEGVTPNSSTSADFKMKHLCSIARFNITLPAEYLNSKIKKMTISAGDNIFVGKGVCNIGSTIINGTPSFDPTDSRNILSLNMKDIIAEEGKVVAYMMMFPAALGGKDINVKLWTETNKSLTGTIHCEADQEGGILYSYDVNVESTGTPSGLPDKPSEGETLNILLVGHSFGVDATEYLPSLMADAGINNVNIGRFYYPNCDLARHYDYFINETPYTYFYCQAGKTKYTNTLNSLKSVLEQMRWDIVIFQQSINIEGAGTYSTYQPYLNDLIKGVKNISIENHNMVPFIGWHMFWGYGGNYSDMFSKIKDATKQMMAETGVNIIIPTGTAFDFVRTKSYSNGDSEAKFLDEIYGDGFHSSRGVGRYLGACTWFEAIIKPIYGVSVSGNGFRMTEMMSGESDAPEGRKFFEVNDIKAPILQQCAVDAVKKPFGE